MSTPTFHTVTSDDFVCGIPLEATPGYGSTSIMVEARGYNLLTNGRADLSSETGWFTVGFFKESGSPDAPHWTGDTLPGDVSVQPDNSGVGFSTIGGPAFVQIRVSMYLPAGMSPTSPGPYMDSWEITFDHNQ